jgi:uncharacterized lipoprotein YehR (DUF1307 family)
MMMKKFLHLLLAGAAIVALSGCAGDGDDYEYAPGSVSLYKLKDGYSIIMERRRGDTLLPDKFCIEFGSFRGYKLYNEANKTLELEGDGDRDVDYIAVNVDYYDNKIAEDDIYDIRDVSVGDKAVYRVDLILADKCYP